MSAERFTASDGYYIERGDLRRPDGALLFNVLKTETAVALIEYGAHKALADRDMALGRWRSVEHPDFVVYRGNSVNSARIIWETSGRSVTAQRTSDGLVLVDGIGQWRHVAVEYFAAHPVAEPKPWEDAKPHEIWVLSFGDSEQYAAAYLDRAFRYPNGEKLPMGGITAGRRIWPKVTS